MKKEHHTNLYALQAHLCRDYNLPDKVNGGDTIIHRTINTFIIDFNAENILPAFFMRLCCEMSHW